MKVFLIRHAHAVDESREVPDDHRYLTLQGREVALAVGEALRERGEGFDALLTSPLVRAVQTAELIGAAIGYRGTVAAVRALAPGVPPRVIAGELAALGVAVAVVGHEPGISALGAWLVQRPTFPPFRKAQVVLIEDGSPKWTLLPDSLELAPVLVA
jgi:phosphohistidine phosphatase